MSRASRRRITITGFLRHPVRVVRRQWARGGRWRRIAMVLSVLVSVIVVLALVMGMVRLIQVDAEIRAAENRQQDLLSLYGFDPGNIISDAKFFNAGSMNAKEIQAFLDEKGAACTGKTCLRSARFSTSEQKADDLCKEYAADRSGKASAATIIAKTAQACSISPTVLLTMLQKEQHLVTATSPSSSQFEAAMGLSCPDTADCDPQYAGFFRQVFGSARRMRYYLAHEDQYGYPVGRPTYIRFSPDASCGGTAVVIRSKATSLLYIYTPYQPNTAALKAGAGEGDSCSSYGNRNFSIIYSGWFSDPT